MNTYNILIASPNNIGLLDNGVSIHLLGGANFQAPKLNANMLFISEIWILCYMFTSEKFLLLLYNFIFFWGGGEQGPLPLQPEHVPE